MPNYQIDRRTYKYKNPHMHFLCPLCNTERYFSIGPRLTSKNYAQIALVTTLLTFLAWPWTNWKGFFSFFMVWSLFEFGRRALFRKEIPCPHCGFDASWYKRDVKVARRLVKEFWDKQQSAVKSPEPEVTEQEGTEVSQNEGAPAPKKEPEPEEINFAQS